ncbi:MAG: ATP-binding cassette domain-containing protein [Burkholderiales bacterium]|nr:MAG: ATP-binding cassette domain-containing protein [Burkholderiales bacterium]
MTGAAPLSVAGVEKRFGGIAALSGVTFAIDAPGVYGLIGPNGAGKTTLFDVIAGETAPDAGRVSLGGEDVTARAPHARAARGIARTFQECRILPEASCLENLLFTAQPKSLAAAVLQSLTRAPGVDAHRVDEARSLLALVNLERYTHEPAASLSFGQRRLLEIVAAFLARPRLLLLDEPAAGVNPALLETLHHAIRTMHSQSGGVFLIVEHNMEFIMSLAGEIIVMHQGAVLERGSPEAVQASPRVLEAYLG